MRKPVVDYRDFRFSKINNEEYSHLLFLLGWVGYFAMYYLTERLIKRNLCYVVHCRLDDIIKFCEIFVVPYVLWYFLIVFTLFFLAFYNPKGFVGFQKFVIVTQIAATLIYIIFPNRQDLRPTVFERDNLLTQTVSLIYSIDTSTNVCPSLHVAISLAIASAWLKEDKVTITYKIIILFMVIIICLSTVFIKQHSVVDILMALPISLLAEIIAYKDRYFKSNAG